MSRRRGSRNTIAQRIFLTVAAVILTGGIWYFSGAGIPLEEASSLAQEVLGTAGEQWDQLKDFSEDLSIPGKASPHPDAGELSLDASIPEGSVRVHVLNVGQALSVLIQTPQANVLIDGGENDTAPDTTGYLQEQGVTRLDLVFNTHPHYDHYGGLRTIMGEIPADAYITPDLPEDQVPTTASYEKLLDFLAESDTSVKPARTGTQYDLGGDVTLTLLGPVGTYDDLNNWSLVLRLDCGDRSFIIPGDIENKAERDLLESGAELSCDVLVLPHHGSSTSILGDFVRAASPAYGVISCGKNNDYGHPHQETLNLYQKLGTQLFRTDEDGTIVFETDGESLEVCTLGAAA